MGQGNPGQADDLRIGVVLEAVLDCPLDRVLSWLPGPRPKSPISRWARVVMRRTRTVMSWGCREG
jgi:hypothetical protein